MAEGGADELLEALRAHADPRRAEQEQAYLKSDLQHLGVPVPVMRRLARQYVRDHPDLDHAGLVALVRALWEPPIHESRSTGALLLEVSVRDLTVADAPLLAELVARSATWAHVDVLAASVAARLMVQDPALGRSLRAWAADEQQWIRRLGILGHLRILKTDAFTAQFPAFAAAVDPLLADRRFFVEKAIGWVLRDASRRHPDEVFAWAEQRWSRMSAVTRREVARHCGGRAWPDPRYLTARPAPWGRKAVARRSGRGSRWS